MIISKNKYTRIVRFHQCGHQKCSGPSISSIFCALNPIYFQHVSNISNTLRVLMNAEEKIAEQKNAELMFANLLTFISA